MKIRFIIAGMVMALCLTLTACGNSESTSDKITSIDELDGMNMGCMSGSIFDMVIKDRFPNSPITYYNSRSDLLLALKSDKIAGFVSDEPVAMMMVADNKDVTYLGESVGSVDYGLCFSDMNLDVRDEFNEYLADIEASGHLKELQDKWICTDGASKKKEEHVLSGKKGTLKCATTPDAAPFSFISDNIFQGYEIEILYEFAEKYGYDVAIDTLSFDALLTAVSTGKYDLAANGIYITPERAKSVNFCNPTYHADDVVMIKGNDQSTGKSFFETIGDMFYRDFIEEDRYLILIQGLIVTIVISLVSVILGTILGLAEYLLSVSSKAFKKIFDIIAKIVGNMPATIVLMLAFYVVFKKSTLSGTIVSIVAFTIMFGAVVYHLLEEGVDAIDIGQTEAALALGYPKYKALIKMILPQAVVVVLGSYEHEIVSLIKSSAVVGYVSVNDLTRASDIIRGRTYDALLPLIVVAILYFVINELFVKLADLGMKKLISKKETGGDNHDTI